MLKNIDFQNVYPILFVSLWFSYNMIFGFSIELGFSWIDVPLNFRFPRTKPSISYGIYHAVIFLFLVFLSLCIAIRKTFKRIKNNETTKTIALFSYFRLFCEYLICLFLLCIFIPIIIPLLY